MNPENTVVARDGYNDCSTQAGCMAWSSKSSKAVAALTASLDISNPRPGAEDVTPWQRRVTMSTSTRFLTTRWPGRPGNPRPSCPNTHEPGATSIAGRLAASFPARAVLAAAVLAATMSFAKAATVLEAEVTESHGSYRMSFEAVLQAPYPRVHRLLTDYPGLPRFNPHIEDITLLPSSDGGALEMRVVSRSCVLVFCKTVMHVQQVREDTPGDIVATVLPEQSDLRQGFMRWRILPEGDRTRLVFEGDVMPAF